MMSQQTLPIPTPINPNSNPNPNPDPPTNQSLKRKRNLPGTPDPDAEVVALSPTSLMATNRFVCEICNKGFQRDQNLQLHRRGHNLPWKLRQRAAGAEVRKKVYVCPEKSCVHHDPSRALGDLTGIKKHFSRKHGEKKWKCEKCSKKYAVHSDWKAHSKICGTREYKCDCGTLFSRKDSFITHRAFCDALADENARFTTTSSITNPSFQSDLMNGHGLNISTQFGGFRPEFLGSAAAEGPKPMRLHPHPQLWAMDQHNHSIGLANDNAGGNAFLNGLPELGQVGISAAAQGSSLFGQPTLQHLPQWLNGTPGGEVCFINSTGNTGGNNMSGLGFGGVLKQEETDNSSYKGNYPDQTTLGCNDLYYSSINAPQSRERQGSLAHHHNSATALLQKAAQIGSSSSNSRNHSHSINAAALGGGSVMTPSSPSPSALSGTPTCFTNSPYGGNLNELLGDMNSGFTAQMLPASSKLQSSSEEVTRDFLGVGAAVRGGRSQFFRQEMAKYACMSAAMDDNLSSHYSGNQ